MELRVVPLTQQYWDRVVAHCIAEMRAGRTPNPDVLCNSRVKFGAFYEHLAAVPAGFDRVASGHYARLERGGGGEAVLALTRDAAKDQTYFLAQLAQAQLARALFPLGHLTKPQVRALAAAADLPNKARKDSQGICFLGKVKFGEFIRWGWRARARCVWGEGAGPGVLRPVTVRGPTKADTGSTPPHTTRREHLGEWPGAIVEEESDEVVGFHRGFWFHTVGQRKGIPLSGGPW